MKATLIFMLLFLTGSIQLVAGTHPPISTAPCLACNIPDGLAASDLTGTSATLTWNAVSGATKYTVEVQDEQNNPSTFNVEINVIGTSFIVTGLQAGVSYKFKVRTTCGSDKSDWSAWVFFVAGSSGGNGACAIPTGLAAIANGNSVTLTWDVVSGAVKYTIEVEDEQNTQSVFHLEDSTTTNTYVVTGLQTGVSYKFKVRASCGGSNNSDWSGWVFFNAGSGGTGGACSVPTGLAASVNGNTATLTWVAVSGAVKYTIEVEDEQNTPSIFHLEDSTTTNIYTLAGLQTGVLYKFKVRTHCTNDQSDWSAWVFLNGNSGGSIGGNTGSCSRPTSTQVSNITPDAALLTWTAVSGVAFYSLEIEREQPGAAPWQITQMVTTNSFSLAGLGANTGYKFKVRSFCSGGGHSNWTKWRKFKTASSFTGISESINLNDPVANREEDQPTFAKNLEVQVSPNPVQTSATIRLHNLSAETFTLRLFDLAGSMVQEQHIQQEGGIWEGTLTLDDLPNGMYLLQTQNGSNTQTSKLVLNH